MVGRADKGLLITTGNFTKEAVREATRDGAPAIDLIDGDLLIDKLKELGLGVETKTVEVEQVAVDSEAEGDLVNFLDGIADGLQSKPQGMQDRHIASVFLQGDSIDARKSLVYHNDGQVDEITAVRQSSGGDPWYTGR
jgi:hypothetical protein